jgi:ubiquinone/menaquinone biosynthesis C-methylase UbiE
MKNYAEINRDMWNTTADVHARVSLPKLLESVKRPDFSTFDVVEREIFSWLTLEGKNVAQLSCNNGRELISCKKAGAARCVGFDIAEKFIVQGRLLATAGNVEVEFVCTNIYDISHEYDHCFDIIYVTIGALGWLQDLDAYFKIVSRLLKPNGHIFIYEMHPVLDMFDAETGLEIKKSYFMTEPDIVEEAPDYLDPSVNVALPSYWFHYKLSDLISGCLENSLNLKHFREYDHDISEVYKAFETLETRPPMCYTLVAQKSV